MTTRRTLFYSVSLSAIIAFLMVSLFACGNGEFIPSSTPTPPALSESVTGVSIFEEIDALGTNEFNNRYTGHRFEIGADWSGMIQNSQVLYAVAIVEQPSTELEFNGRGEGKYWKLDYTSPHDGKIIVGKFLYGREAYAPTYHCIVKDYFKGTLTLDRCVPKK